MLLRLELAALVSGLCVPDPRETKPFEYIKNDEL